MSTLQFVYQPRAGDRVFASNPTEEIVVVRWENGCRHIVGGVHLQYFTASAGQWWRAPARAVVTSLVNATGGIAWDEQGIIHCIFPRMWAFRANKIMEGSRIGGDEHGRLVNDNALVAVNCAAYSVKSNADFEQLVLISSGYEKGKPLSVEQLPDSVKVDGCSLPVPETWTVRSVEGGIQSPTEEPTE